MSVDPLGSVCGPSRFYEWKDDMISMMWYIACNFFDGGLLLCCLSEHFKCNKV